MSIAVGDPDHSRDAGPTDANTRVDEPVTDLDRVRRWQDLGGIWRVLARHGDRVTISLCRCDAGEEMERLTSTNPAVLEFLGDRDASDE
jgi:hypothetical protein